MSFFANEPFDKAAQFHSELNTRREFHLGRLAARPRLCSEINDAMNAVDQFTKDGELFVHPCWSQNTCAILYLLLMDYEEHGATVETIGATEAAFVAAVRQFLEMCAAQAERLCGFLLDIRDRFAGMRIQEARFVILELPVGNSLVARLLEHLLSALLPVVTIKAALNRNDLPEVGITRESLLARELQKAGLKQNDLVVLVDEWKTGTNFHHICQRLTEIIPAGVFFFPFAVLEGSAPSTAKMKKRFTEYTTEHNAILGKVGLVGAEFRRRLPAVEPLNLFTPVFLLG